MDKVKNEKKSILSKIKSFIKKRRIVTDKVKIEIKSRTGDILFEYEKENNSLKDTLEEAIKQSIDLRYADLRYTNLKGADLLCADLRYANLEYADLGNANLKIANLKCADLLCADLRYADLRYADLEDANLKIANLLYADFRYADLRYADLGDANLLGTDLRHADLEGADPGDAKNTPFIPLACPSDGEFTGWKKVKDKLIQLLIPADAKRSSATTNKCRCDKAKVVAITDIDGSRPVDSITCNTYVKTEYKVGEYVYPDLWDDNRWKECSHGIHFFINKQDAINY